MGRVGESHFHQLLAEQGLIFIDLGCIATKQFVLTKHPDVTRLGDRSFGDLRYSIFIGQAVLGLIFAGNQSLARRWSRSSEYARPSLRAASSRP